MPELKGSKTEKNLLAAFAGESQARNKYTYYASVARKEGFEQIAEFFLETAENEKEHAKLQLAALGGIGDTAANLKDAAGGEHYEWTQMYPAMVKDARQEGFDDIARMFEGIIKIEKAHEERYHALLKNLETKAVFSRDRKVKWRCRNCGFTFEGTAAPPQCPVCKHPQAFFEIVAENY